MAKTKSFSELLKIVKPKEELNKLGAGTIFNIPFDGKDHKFVVLGININPNPDSDYDFMDIMSLDLLLENISWKEKIKYPDSISDSEHSFLNYTRSDIINQLAKQKEKFPEEIQNAIIPRKAKFLTGADLLSGEKKYDYVNIGDIWIPSLKEIIGECRYSDDCHDNDQYPYFENENNRKLGGYWWTRSARAFYHGVAFCINPSGGWDNSDASDSCGAPLCLRLKINRD